MSIRIVTYPGGHLCPGLSICGGHPRWHVVRARWRDGPYFVYAPYTFASRDICDTWDEAMAAALKAAT